MAPGGITLRTSDRLYGMAGRTLMVSELDSHTRLLLDGASVSDMDMDTIRTTTRGGDLWDITAVVGIRITGGEHGVVLPWQMYMECGATRRIHVQVLPGRIRTRAITVRRPAERIKTHRQVGLRSRDVDITPMSILAIQRDIAAGPHTIQTLASLQVAEQVTPAIFIRAKVLPVALGSLTTPIPKPVLLLERTISTQARMAPYTATTGTAEIGQATLGAAGKTWTDLNQSSRTSSKCGRRERSAPKTSVRCAVPVGCAEVSGDARFAKGYRGISAVAVARTLTLGKGQATLQARWWRLARNTVGTVGVANPHQRAI